MRVERKKEWGKCWIDGKDRDLTDGKRMYDNYCHNFGGFFSGQSQVSRRHQYNQQALTRLDLWRMTLKGNGERKLRPNTTRRLNHHPSGPFISQKARRVKPNHLMRSSNIPAACIFYQICINEFGIIPFYAIANCFRGKKVRHFDS